VPTRNGIKCNCPQSGDLLNGAYNWPFQTNDPVEYAAGFYDFAGAADDFSPAINWGSANIARAAHVSLVTGAIAVGEVQVTVSGTSITDDGVRTGSDSEVIVIPDGTPANSYFETAKKWNGQVPIETTSGTPISCNYFWSKYHDVGNTDFIIGLVEALWISDSTDSGSNIELLHHKAGGWIYNAGGGPTIPTAIASRSTDYGAENTHEVGSGAWKRTDLSVLINGSNSEGFLFRITSGNTGGGSLSFRSLGLELSLRMP